MSPAAAAPDRSGRRRAPRWLCALPAALAISLSFGSVRSAQAQPSFWDGVRDPKLKKSHAALVDIERVWRSLVSDSAERRTRDLRAYLFPHALGLLRQRPENLPSVELKVAAADLLYRAGHARGAGEGMATAQEMLRAAKALLEQAVIEEPEGPLAARAYFDLGIISALLGEPEREYEAYTRVLELEPGPAQRAVAYYNRGDTSMLLGKLDLAIADYRRSIATYQEPKTHALAHWGLSLALERSGDLPSALEAARKAASVLPVHWKHLLESDTAFFVPAYDLYYYQALTLMALARSADKLAAAKEYYEESIHNWSKYVAAAREDNQPWMQNALLHRQSCERDLKKVRDKLAKEPPPKRGRSFQFELEIPFQWPPVPSPPARVPFTP